VDLANWRVIDHHADGEKPEVLAYDPDADREYIVAESGWGSVLDHKRGHGAATAERSFADRPSTQSWLKFRGNVRAQHQRVWGSAGQSADVNGFVNQTVRNGADRFDTV
jgi:hypothetical protein